MVSILVVMNAYLTNFAVLTPAGYLHEHGSSDPTRHPHPELSLFLPECTLGAPSTQASKSHKFHISAKTSNVKSLPGLGKSDHAYTFRARSHEEMMEWWNDIKQLSKVYLTSSEQMDRSGPVPAAVRAAGYRSEDEEEEEEDGSSVEEEDDEYEEPEDSHADQLVPGESTDIPASGEEQIPAYSGAAKGSGIEIGSNGYAVEKKNGDGEGPAGEPSQDAVQRAAGKEKAGEESTA